MNSALLQPLTIEEFLEWEDRQEFKHEFNGVGAVATVGGTAAHSTIQGNLAFQLVGRLAGKPCRFHGSDFKLRLADSVRYTDGLVVRTKVDPSSTWITDPVVIFEVLSDSAAHVDFGAQAREYEATPSVQRYAVLHQDEVAATQFACVDGDWVGHILKRDAMVEMPEIGVCLPSLELYAGLEM